LARKEDFSSKIALGENGWKSPQIKGKVLTKPFEGLDGIAGGSGAGSPYQKKRVTKETPRGETSKVLDHGDSGAAAQNFKELGKQGFSGGNLCGKEGSRQSTRILGSTHRTDRRRFRIGGG